MSCVAHEQPIPFAINFSPVTFGESYGVAVQTSVTSHLAKYAIPLSYLFTHTVCLFCAHIGPSFKPVQRRGMIISVLR